MPATYDTETIRMITLFENTTRARVKDCLMDDASGFAYFVIEEGDVGLAIGKNGVGVKRVENLLQKNVKVFEFSEDVAQFVKKIIPQATEVKILNEEGRTVVEIRVDRNNRAMVIGRDGKNLKLYKELLERNHNVSDLTVK